MHWSHEKTRAVEKFMPERIPVKKEIFLQSPSMPRDSVLSYAIKPVTEEVQERRGREGGNQGDLNTSRKQMPKMSSKSKIIKIL